MFFFFPLWIQNTCFSEGDLVGRNKPCFPIIGSCQVEKEILQTNRLPCHSSVFPRPQTLLRPSWDQRLQVYTVACWFPFLISGLTIQSYTLAEKHDTSSLYTCSQNKLKPATVLARFTAATTVFLSFGRMISLHSVPFLTNLLLAAVPVISTE